MGIARAIIETCVASIPKGMEGAEVAAVNLKIGKLSTVVPESLRFCFDALRGGTPLSGARLDIEEVPVALRCVDCGRVTTVEAATFACGACGGPNTRQIAGRELTIESIELAGPADPASAAR